MNNPPAFPSSNEVTLNDWVSSGHSGMTLRDYFAAKAMQGICASDPSIAMTNARIAAEAYDLADAMMKAREG
jgi:hypothetical protein